MAVRSQIEGEQFREQQTSTKQEQPTFPLSNTTVFLLSNKFALAQNFPLVSARATRNTRVSAGKCDSERQYCLDIYHLARLHLAFVAAYNTFLPKYNMNNMYFVSFSHCTSHCCNYAPISQFSLHFSSHSILLKQNRRSAVPGFGFRFHTFPVGMASSKNSRASP